MRTYRTKTAFISDMGSIPSLSGLSDKSTETKEEEALWHINSMRDHDGLSPLDELPSNIVFEPEPEK